MHMNRMNAGRHASCWEATPGRMSTTHDTQPNNWTLDLNTYAVIAGRWQPYYTEPAIPQQHAVFKDQASLGWLIELRFYVPPDTK